MAGGRGGTPRFAGLAIRSRRPVNGFMKFRLGATLFCIVLAVLWFVESDLSSARISILVALMLLAGFALERRMPSSEKKDPD